MKQAYIIALAFALALGGCATTEPQKDPGIIVQEKYIVPIPPQDLTEPPAQERDVQLRVLDENVATDKDLASLLIDKQAYINALEKNMAKLRQWYKERLELLKQTIRPEDIRIIE